MPEMPLEHEKAMTTYRIEYMDGVVEELPCARLGTAVNGLWLSRVWYVEMVGKKFKAREEFISTRHIRRWGPKYD